MGFSIRTDGGAIFELPQENIASDAQPKIAKMVIGDKTFSVSVKILSAGKDSNSSSAKIEDNLHQWITLTSTQESGESSPSIMIEKDSLERAFSKEPRLGDEYAPYCDLFIKNAVLFKAAEEHTLSPLQLQAVRTLLNENSQLINNLPLNQTKRLSNRSLLPFELIVKKDAKGISINLDTISMKENPSSVRAERHAISKAFKSIISESKARVSISGKTWKEIDFVQKGQRGNVIALGNELGAGASKVARIAVSLTTGKKYAHLTLTENAKRYGGMQALEHEIELSSQLKHKSDHIVLIKKITTAQGTTAGLSELCKHDMSYQIESLCPDENDQIQEYKMTPSKLKSMNIWSLHIAQGLAALHSENICHLDIKPDNIYLKDDISGPEGLRAKVGDLGFASKAGSHVLKGTVSTMAPELLQNLKSGKTIAADPSMDVWSFGATVFMMRNGMRIASVEAFEEARDTGKLGTLLKEVGETRAELMKSQDPIDYLLAKTLDKDPLKRPTMDECIRVLSQEVQA